ncbi:Gfo/Idh/MocA family oxidoreductase [Litorilinea aerophila]|uniref:Gfo/Idh/MocA family oxidoreductase n=1 Tax=Litorilinea aerophila TaxID=1204385 RepID=A0A540VAB8_9CHLR|nr:Gfo/Idh/MocA family oxidoreductase [Litorilinea aerophila]MCC9078437.1 Gfo/Idh/MocA family oxidoreductase [Litorilinea aerophila]
MINGNQPVRIAMVGCGGMARNHTRRILQQQDTTQICFACEPSGQAYEAFCELFAEVGLEPPPNVPDLEQLLQDHADELDAAFIITPHAFHHDQARACLEAGLDVLLEKPMVLNAQEAESLIQVRDRTGRLLVVSFNGSLSPQIRTAVQLLRSGELGQILNIHAVAWQSWKAGTTGTWRQNPALAGGGFLFDTGAHMLNTVADLAGEDFVEVAAWLDNRGTPVDILGTVMARTRSGAFVTLSACGDTIKSCASDVRVFCTQGILQTGIWGERLLLQRSGEADLSPVPVPPSLGQWEQFLRVRRGEMANPCPPEVGLRMARLWDAIQASAAQGGVPVQTGA